MSLRSAVLLVVAACGGGGGDVPDATPFDAGVDADVDGDDGTCPGDDPSECPSQEACDRGECVDIDFYVCENGEWVRVICEGVIADVVGTWTLTQEIASTTGDCPALTPRDPLVLTVSAQYEVSAEPPVVIVEAMTSPDWGVASLTATLTDDWGAAVTVEYDLDVDELGYVYGAATATIDACTASVSVTGMRMPP